MDDGNATAAAPPAATGESAREARRRKILDRGTDRLAFITGQAKSVIQPPPPSPADHREHQEEGNRGKVDISPSLNIPPSRLLQNPELADGNTRKSLAPDIGVELRPKRQSTDSVKTNVGLLLQDPELIDGNTRKSWVSDIGVELLPKRESTESTKTNVGLIRPISPASENSSSLQSDARSVPQQGSKYKIFTIGRLTHCISSSENIRLVCAAAIAVFVVLSFRGTYSGTRFMFFRPIFLVLITDITLVLAMLFANKDVPFIGDEAIRTGGQEFDLGELISLGIVVYKVTSAIFADCCLCAVLMIVGIPFAKNL